MTILYILLGLIIFYLIEVIVTFIKNIKNYNDNLKRVEQLKDYEDFINEFKSQNKWKKICRPIWYSWLAVIFWIENRRKINIDQLN